MYVTYNKDLSVDEIRNLSVEELREIFKDRIEKWIIEPIELLDKQEHTGFAIALLLREMIDATGYSDPYVTTFLRDGGILNSDLVFVTGNIGHVFYTSQCLNYVKINPLRAAVWCRELLATMLRGYIDTDKLRYDLIRKASKALKNG